LHDQRQGLSLFVGKAFQENALCAFIFHQQSDFFQIFDDCRQQRVVERFAAFCQANVERVINDLKLAAGLLAKQLPSAAGVFGTCLQFDYFFAGGFLESFILIKPLFLLVYKS
jgi:hypothetical protein